MLSHTMHEAAKVVDGHDTGLAVRPDNNQAPAFDPADYLPLLEDYDITDDQAREMLATLWQIMRACVELGISVDVCGELGGDAVPVLSNEPASLSSEGS